MINLTGIEVKFGDFTALKDINIHVQEGQFYTFLGPSGCGKTTTLRTITGFIKPTQGRVVVKGKDITDMPVEKRNIGMVFQNYALFPTMSVYENIAFGLRVNKVNKTDIDRRVREMGKKVELSDKQMMRKVAELSGGQQQRVAIARALVNNPAIICLDEPLSNLDAKLRSDMRTELIQLHEELKSTFIYVTHDQIEAMTMGTNIVVMNEGRVMQQGSPTEIHNDPNCVFVAQFVGDPGMNIVAAGDYQVGFRPRDVEFDCADRDEEHVVIRRRVRSFENHGSEFLYLLDTPEKVFVKELSKRQRPLNEPFTVRIHRDDLYVFGRDGKRIYASEEVAKAYAEFKRNWQSV